MPVLGGVGPKYVKMKLWRILFVVVVALLLDAGSARAQYYRDMFDRPSKRMEMGLSVGASYMNLSTDNVLDVNPKLGIRAALAMSLCWHDQFALQMELGYIYNKIETTRGTAAYEVDSGVMEIPILFSYRGLGPMRFNLGPVLSLAGTGRYGNGRERIEFGRLRSTLGYTAGVGVELTQHLVVDARFTANFARQSNYFEGVEFLSSSSWVGLNVSYMF